MLFQKIINYTVGTQLFVRRSSFVDFQECVWNRGTAFGTMKIICVGAQKIL